MGLWDKIKGAISKPLGKNDSKKEIQEKNIENAKNILNLQSDKLGIALKKRNFTNEEITAIQYNLFKEIKKQSEDSPYIVSVDEWNNRIKTIIIEQLRIHSQEQTTQKNNTVTEPEQKTVATEKTTEELSAEVNKNITEAIEQIQESNQTLQNDSQYANGILQKGFQNLNGNIRRSQETLNRANGSKQPFPRTSNSSQNQFITNASEVAKAMAVAADRNQKQGQQQKNEERRRLEAQVSLGKDKIKELTELKEKWLAVGQLPKAKEKLAEIEKGLAKYTQYLDKAEKDLAEFYGNSPEAEDRSNSDDQPTSNQENSAQKQTIPLKEPVRNAINQRSNNFRSSKCRYSKSEN